VAHDDSLTRYIAIYNDNYKFSACLYSILQEFAVENEVNVTSHPEIRRELHVQCTCSSKVLKRFAFITNKLDVLWDSGIRSAFNGDDSPLVAACALLELSSLTASSSWKPTPPSHRGFDVIF